MTDSRTPLDAALDLVVYAPLGLALTISEELPKLAEKGRNRVTSRVATARLVGQFAVTQGRREVGRRLPGAPGGVATAPGRSAQSPGPARAASGAAPSAPVARRADGPASVTRLRPDPDAPGAAAPAGASETGATSPPGAAASGSTAPGPTVSRTGPGPQAAGSSTASRPSGSSTSSRPSTPSSSTRSSTTPSPSSATSPRSSASSTSSAQPPPAAGLAIPRYDSLSASQVVQRLAGLAPGELDAVKAYEASTRGRRTILARIGQLQG